MILKHAMTGLFFAGIAASQTFFTAQAEDRTDMLQDFYKAADARPFDADTLKDFLADDFVDHDTKASEGTAHADAFVGIFAALEQGAPDSYHEITLMEPAGDDKVVLYWRYKGIHTGSLFGMPATEKPFDIAGIEIYRIQDSKISEVWHVEDIAGLLGQLGMAK